MDSAVRWSGILAWKRAEIQHSAAAVSSTHPQHPAAAAAIALCNAYQKHVAAASTSNAELSLFFSSFN